jgi:signal transduction histidine kinase
VSLTEADGCANLAVMHTGEGISSEFIPLVFDPFTQGKSESSRQGLGPGLMIVKYLVDAHHGQVSVESSGRHRGATFTVRLPLQESISDGAISPLAIHGEAVV